MLEQIRSQIVDVLDQRGDTQATLDAIIAAAETEGRSDLTSEEVESIDAARNELRTLDTRIEEQRAREADLVEMEARKADAAEVRQAFGTAKAAPVAVRTEARTYRPDGEHDFLADALAAKRGDARAADRLERNRREAEVDYRSTTGNFGGLVVPQYLTEQFAPVLVSGRPFLSAVTNIALPAGGMNLTIPRGATGTSVAAQTTENTAVTNQTYTESDLVVPVRTFAGQQVVSKQSIDRGTGIDGILMADLFQQYATQVNVSAISGTGASGAHWGILNTTSVSTVGFTGTTATALVSSIHNALGKVNASRYAAADLIVMHPRRWAFLCAGSDSSNRPLVEIVGGSGMNVVGQGSAPGYGVVGSIAGVPVITDAAVPTTAGTGTNEDRIIVTRRQDVLFMEDAGAPIGLELEEVLADQLSVRMVAYGYSAFTAGRYPVGTCIIQGTGLANVLS